MTVSRVPVLACDHMYGDGAVCLVRVSGGGIAFTVAELRVLAAAAGWTRPRINGVRIDLCQVHVLPAGTGAGIPALQERSCTAGAAS